MIIRGEVGEQFLSDGADSRFRQGRQGELMVSELHGRYYEAALRGRVFCAANQAAAALSLLSATATGLILTNPAGSGKNLELLEIAVALATAPAGIATLGLAANVNVVAAAVVHTTPLIVRPTLIGGSLGAVGLADSAATLPAAPVLIRGIGGGPVATGSVTAPFIKDDVGGAIILAPGTAISLSAFTTAISVIASFTWAEWPV